MNNSKLIIKNAKENNLKNISLELPKNKLVVITGISGSGKSSLAFDTIYAEGQRRYVESLNSYARQFLGLMEKPNVEYIEGLSPAISIDQKTASHNPRSTVGTVTEIYDYLRLLFARIGKPYDPKTGKLLESQTIHEIVARIEAMSGKLMILAPLVQRRKGTYEELFQKLINKGFFRVRVDGKIFELDQEIKLDRYKMHDIEVVIDRIALTGGEVDSENHKRILDSVELSVSMSKGEVYILDADTEKIVSFAEQYVLSNGESFPKLEPNLFSFNAPAGACSKCSGLGYMTEIDSELLYNPKLTIAEGGIFPWSRSWDMSGSWYRMVLEEMCLQNNIDTKTPIGELSEKQKDMIFYGTGEKKYSIHSKDGNKSFNTKYEGVVNNLQRRFKETESEAIREEISQYMREVPCDSCKGARLSIYSLSVKINGENILNVAEKNITDALSWAKSLIPGNSDKALTDFQYSIAHQVIKEIVNRLGFLESVGLDYLTLSRTAKTLSGGEAQRIRLASQIGAGLTGVMYILDEPSIGLHQKDNEKLIGTLKYLRDIGNTVIVVEHDEDTMMAADWIVEIGPGAGVHGGEVVFNGPLDKFLTEAKTETSDYLTRRKQINMKNINAKIQTEVLSLNDLEVDAFNTKKIKKDDSKNEIIIHGARANNLKNITVKIPLKKFISVTGASGSGKSTLINDILANALLKEINDSKVYPADHDSIEGLDNVDKVIIIDQSPIGRTPRSNPATYTGVFTAMREIFASTKEAKLRGYGPGRFSFNTKGGRCEKCKGDGLIKIEMQFLPDVYVTCESCNGKRYNADTLTIDYNGKNIFDVLDMTVEDAVSFFQNFTAIHSKLETLNKVGLGYIKLGQSATTLSGGEAQRVKLATELAKRQSGNTFYILDEPTTGLHFSDIEKLLVVLHSLVRKGNSVLVIEHNLDVIKTSDWIIDLGPEGGQKGGNILVEGTLDDIIKCKSSYTGQFLSRMK